MAAASDEFDEPDDPTEGAEPFEPTGNKTGKGRPSQSKFLIEQIAGAELWHNPDGEAFATVPVNGHFENYRIRSKLFKSWLVGKYYRKRNSAPGGDAFEAALKVIEAQAIHDFPENPTWIRVGEADGAIYINLCNDAWQVIKITAEGREIIAKPPIKFLRTNAMRAMYRPEAGGSIDDLRDFVNVKTEGDFRLLVAWLVMALRSRGPYPILLLNGEQGSAKSTLTRLIRMLIDPSKAPVRAPPRDDRELMIMSCNSHVIALDNLSGVPPWLSDGLCRLATGGGFSTRELFSDFSEIVFEGQRPSILNGIPDLGARPDLADRGVVVTLPPIEDADRKLESAFWTDFDVAAPFILGALLDAVSGALERVSTVELDSPPRMADFAMWVTAAEPSLGWSHGDFLEAYRMNRADAVEMALEADVVAVEIRRLLDPEKGDPLVSHFDGTPSEVLARIEEHVDDRIKDSKRWPKAANTFSNRLRRVADALRRVGIDVTTERVGRGRSRRNNIRIVRRHDPDASADAVPGSEARHDCGKVEPLTPAP